MLQVLAVNGESLLSAVLRVGVAILAVRALTAEVRSKTAHFAAGMSGPTGECLRWPCCRPVVKPIAYAARLPRPKAVHFRWSSQSALCLNRNWHRLPR